MLNHKYDAFIRFPSYYTLCFYWIVVSIFLFLVCEYYEDNKDVNLEEIIRDKWSLKDYIQYLNYVEAAFLKMKVISIFIFLSFDPVLHTLNFALFFWSLNSTKEGSLFTVMIILYYSLVPMVPLIFVIKLISLLYDTKYIKNKNISFIKKIINFLVSVCSLMVFDIAFHDLCLIIIYSKLLVLKCFCLIIQVVIIYLFYLCIFFFIHLVYFFYLFVYIVIKI